MAETTNDDTGTGAAGTQEGEGAEAPSQNGSQGGQDPVSLLTSRLNGQTAKVGELTGTLKAKDEALAAALARVAELEAGTVSADEAAKAQVAAAQAELERERRERRIEGLKSRFPETFSELGEDVATVMDETKLAAIEARLTGAEGGDEPPTPLRHNETKTGTKTPAKEETAADVEARLMSMNSPW